MKRRRRSAAELAAHARFREVVLAKGYCIGTIIEPGHVCDGRMDPHHVIRQQVLKEWFFGADVDYWAVVHDPRNGVPACDRIHTPLTSKVGRNGHIPFHLVPLETVDFALEYGITHLLERECPRDPLF